MYMYNRFFGFLVNIKVKLSICICICVFIYCWVFVCLMIMIMMIVKRKINFLILKMIKYYEGILYFLYSFDFEIKKINY